MSARDDYPHLANAWGTDTARALDEIDRLRAEIERLTPREARSLGGFRDPEMDR